MGFIGSVQVHTAGGSHGNLGATGVKGGRRIPIPDAIGNHATTLRPIVVNLGTQTLRIPGQYIVVAVLLEEDNSDSDGIENGHQAVRLLIELEVNDFINNLSGTEIRAAAEERAQQSGGDVLGHAQAIVIERFDQLAGTIRGKAKSAVTLEILVEHTPGFFWELVDADDMLDARTLRFDERDLVTGAVGPVRPIAEALTEVDDDDNTIESMYVLAGSITTSLRAVPSDLRQTAALISSVVGATGEHVFAADRLCVRAGQRAVWTRHDQVEEYTLIFQYPFLPLHWTIDGKELVGSDGEIRLQKTCRFPFFHPEGRERPAQHEEQREVVISFVKFRENGLEGLRLRNRPQDGSYLATLSLGATTNGVNRVHLMSTDCAFEGQLLDSPFYAEFKQCIDQFRSVGEDYAKSKRVGPKELWGPGQKRRWFEEQMQRAETLVAVGELSRARLDAIQKVAQKRLRIER
jgi:hypothetical protein